MLSGDSDVQEGLALVVSQIVVYEQTSAAACTSSRGGGRGHRETLREFVRAILKENPDAHEACTYDRRGASAVRSDAEGRVQLGTEGLADRAHGDQGHRPLKRRLWRADR
jgi:hypothetical protein